MTMQKARRLALQFTVLFAFWLALSGKFEVKYLFFGVISAMLVTFVTQDLLDDLLASERQRRKKKSSSAASLLMASWKFLGYVVWLLYSIAEANLQVAYVVLHPKLPIEPGLLRFRTRLRSEIGHVILANSITLTPGTITVHFSEGTYLVHTLMPQAAGSLLDAQMQSKLEAIFGEPEEARPEIRWVGEDL